MALFWAYTPESDELEILARIGAPDASGEGLKERKALFVGAYIELQAYCSRKSDRYLDRFELLACGAPDEDGGEFDAWIIDALCTPLPNRPPLVHTPGGTGTMCPFEGCLDRCLDEACDCSIGAWREGAEARLCLTR